MIKKLQIKSLPKILLTSYFIFYFFPLFIISLLTEHIIIRLSRIEEKTTSKIKFIIIFLLAKKLKWPKRLTLGKV